ncbi:hypothetical protein MNBD_ALPHA09-1133 [hydrothermal vent metagenome]|uniref:Nudix hydrolase domain-containing protein n=1 Tax=hydrothermal vent metagenome TaxID=652676 RepID=A0A3B0TF89_9ZZZZ
MSGGATIRDAAVLVVIDTGRRGTGHDGAPRVLMGRRHGAMAFMANKVVFPGGRVEAADHRLALPVSLSPRTEAALGHGLSRRAPLTLPRALALAAIRETAEEAGALLAHAPECGTGCKTTRSASWRPLLAGGHVPAIDRLHYFARAITPPGRARRFDTRFFLADASHLAANAGPAADGELNDVGWIGFDAARATDLAPITRTVLDEAQARLSELAKGRMVRPLPFFDNRHGRIKRDWIPAG